MFKNWNFYTFTAKLHKVQKISFNGMTLFCEGFCSIFVLVPHRTGLVFCSRQEGHGQDKEVIP